MLEYQLSVAAIPQTQKPEPKQIPGIRQALTQTGLTYNQLVQYCAPPYSYTFAPAIYSGDTITNDSWVAQQVYCLDFDGGTTVEQVLSRFQDWGITPNYYYHTFNHTIDCPRFRVVLLCDYAVTNSSTAQKIRQGLKRLFPEADKACFDSARIFYGGVDCVPLNDQPIPYDRLHALVGITAIDADKGKTRNVPDRVSLYNYYRGTRAETDNHKEYTEYLKRLKNNKADFEKLADRIQIFKDFIDGNWLYHNELFGLATSLHWLKGGKKLFKDTINKHNLAKKTQYGKEKLRIIDYVAHQEYYPMGLNNYSPYDSDFEYPNLITAIKLPIGQVERIAQTNYITLDQAMSEFTTKFNLALNADDNDIYIFRIPTGFGKTTQLTNLLGHVIAFPTHDLKDEVALNMQVNYKTTPPIPTFTNPITNQKIDHYYRCGLNNEVIRLISMIAATTNSNDSILAQDYLDDLNNVHDTNTTLLTTHQRVVMGGLSAATIIFDEDPIKDLLSVGETNLDDLILLGAKLPQDYNINDLVEYVTAAQPGIVYLMPRTNIPIDVMVDTVATNPTRTNVIQFIQSFAFVKNQNGKINYLSQRSFCTNQKYIILSATAQSHLYQQLYPGRVQVVDLTNIQFKGVVNQHFDRSFSRASLTDDVIQVIKTKIGTLPVITFKGKKNNFESAVSNMHYGNVLGYNALNGQDLAVVGTPHLNDAVYRLYAFAVGLDPNLEGDMAIRQVEYGCFRFCFMTFSSVAMQQIQLGLIEAELIQAVGRARPLRNECRIELFSNLPLPFSNFK